MKKLEIVKAILLYQDLKAELIPGLIPDKMKLDSATVKANLPLIIDNFCASPGIGSDNCLHCNIDQLPDCAGCSYQIMYGGCASKCEAGHGVLNKHPKRKATLFGIGTDLSRALLQYSEEQD